MSTKFCNNCKQMVNTKRVIGVGTFLLALITSGISLLFIPVYKKRCPLCLGSNFNRSDNIIQSVYNNTEKGKMIDTKKIKNKLN